MPRRTTSLGLLSGLLVAAFLTGCSGLLLLAAWEQWFKDSGDNPADYRVFLNGYDIAAAATPNGILSLPGLLEGDYLITVALPPQMRRGLHATVHVQPGKTVSLRSVNPFEGGVITGTVKRDSTTGPVLANVRVLAVRNGPALLAASAPLEFPQTSSTSVDYMMGYTDSVGNYRLGPAQFGDWLVMAAVAGYSADAKYTRVESGRDGTAALVLMPETPSNAGVVRGTVMATGGSALQQPLLTAKLGTPFEPTILDTTRAQVSSDSHISLPPGPWFRLGHLTAIGSDAGVYLLDLPPGSHTLEAFKFGKKATEAPITIGTGSVVTQDFTLPGA